MTDDTPHMLDLRALGQRDVEQLEEIAAEALFNPDLAARERAIGELKHHCPNVVGAYARNRIIFYLREPKTEQIYQAYLCDLKGPFNSLKSYPFLDIDGKG